MKGNAKNYTSEIKELQNLISSLKNPPYHSATNNKTAQISRDLPSMNSY
jgi:hypothetical protein